MADKEHLFYIGRRRNKGKTVHAFVTSTDDESFVFYRSAPARVFRQCVIGVQYDMSFDQWPSWWADHKVGQAPDNVRLEWQAKDRDTELRNRKVEKSPELESILADLRAARLRLPYNRRIAFDAWVLDKIR